MLIIRQVFLICFFIICQFQLQADEYETFAKNGKYGLKNTTSGEIIIPPQYESIGWSDGTFRIINNVIGARQNEKWALINLDGSKISSHLYAELTPYLDNLFIASRRKRSSILSTYGVVNSRGKVIIDFDYARIEPAQSSLIVTKRIGSDYRYGLLNKNGKSLIPLEFTGIQSVKAGFFAVQNDDKLNAIYTEKGQPITDFQFESVTELTDELFLVTFYNKKGLLDKSGKLVVAPIYKHIELSDNKARALPFKKWDFYENDEFSKSFYFDRMLMVDEANFAVTSGQRTGIINKDEQYEKYLSKLKVIQHINEITIIEHPESSYQGALSTTGKLILATNYDSVTVVNGVLIGQIKRIDKQDWTGFDKSGKKLNLSAYESFKALENSLILASRNGKKGLLAPNGKEQTPFIYDAIGVFRNGLAVASYQGGLGVIDLNGNWVITPYNDQIEILDRVIKLKQGSEWKLVDFTGREKVRSYDMLTALPTGYTKQKAEGYELYSANDSLSLDHIYDSIHVIDTDLYALTRDSLYFFFNPYNQEDIALDSGVAGFGIISEGLIPVFKDGQWGQVDKFGKLRIANRYEAIQPFSEDLAAIQLLGKWGFIDRDENLVIQPIYDSVTPFSEDLSVVNRDGYYGLLNNHGQLILKAQFTTIDRQKAYIILNSNGVYGLADNKGKLIRTPQYDSITALKNDYFLIERDGLKGVINLKGQDVIPLSYESIQQMGNRFLASEPSKWELISLK